MKKTHTEVGSFYKGHKYDLPESIISQLPKNCFEKTCAPWDEHKDEKALAAEELHTKALEAKLNAASAVSQIARLRDEAVRLVHPAKAAQDEAAVAEQNAKVAMKVAESRKATDQQKAEAVELVHISDRAEAKRDKAQAELQLAMANARLAELDAEDVKRQADELCNQAGIKFDEPKTEQSKTAAGEPAKDAADSEGQTAPAEQAQH